MPELSSVFAEADLALADPRINETRIAVNSDNAPFQPAAFTELASSGNQSRAKPGADLLAHHIQELEQTNQQIGSLGGQRRAPRELTTRSQFLSQRVDELRQEDQARQRLRDNSNAMLF